MPGTGHIKLKNEILVLKKFIIQSELEKKADTNVRSRFNKWGLVMQNWERKN